MRLGVDPGELGVVVEHLLEMRDEPDGVRRVPMKPAAELVVDAAVRHAVECPARERQCSGIAGGGSSEQELDRHRLRELGRATPAAVRGVE